MSNYVPMDIILYKIFPYLSNQPLWIDLCTQTRDHYIYSKPHLSKRDIQKLRKYRMFNVLYNAIRLFHIHPDNIIHCIDASYDINKTIIHCYYDKFYNRMCCKVNDMVSFKRILTLLQPQYEITVDIAIFFAQASYYLTPLLSHNTKQYLFDLLIKHNRIPELIQFNKNSSQELIIYLINKVNNK